LNKPTQEQAHLQFTRAYAQTKNCKRAYSANADRKESTTAQQSV